MNPQDKAGIEHWLPLASTSSMRDKTGLTPGVEAPCPTLFLKFRRTS